MVRILAHVRVRDQLVRVVAVVLPAQGDVATRLLGQLPQQSLPGRESGAQVFLVRTYIYRNSENGGARFRVTLRSSQDFGLVLANPFLTYLAEKN